MVEDCILILLLQINRRIVYIVIWKLVILGGIEIYTIDDLYCNSC